MRRAVECGFLECARFAPLLNRVNQGNSGIPRLILIAFLSLGSQSGLSQLASDKPTAPNFEPNIPVVFFETKERLDYNRVTKTSVRIEYPKDQPGAVTNMLKGELKFHGAISMGFEKKSLGLKLEEAQPLLGMQKRTHWVLNAAYIDRSLMRHKLSYDLYRAMGTKGHPRYSAASQFVKIFMNGQYQGVSLLMERVDHKLLCFREFSKSDPEHACIYKSVDHSARFDQNGHDGYEQHEPNPRELQYWKPIDDLNRFANRSRDAAFFDPTNGIGSRIDLDSVIDFHLLLLMTSNLDSPTKNFVIARDAPRNGVTPLFFFVPWDFDATFGRNWDARRVHSNVWLSNYLYDRLLGNADYRKRYVERWKTLRQSTFSVASIHKMIDDNVHALGPAATRNAKRWPTTQGFYPDSLTFDQDIAEMKQFVTARAEWLDRTINDLARH